jgi:hypothetical protein
MSLDEGQTHFVGDGCQPAHDPAIDQAPDDVSEHYDARVAAEAYRRATTGTGPVSFEELHAEYLVEIDAKVRAEKEVERLQRENGSLARMSALTEEKLRERTGRLNQAIARLSVIVEAFAGDCRLDHHGFCQEHLVTKPCEILEARRFLASLGSD